MAETKKNAQKSSDSKSNEKCCSKSNASSEKTSDGKCVKCSTTKNSK